MKTYHIAISTEHCKGCGLCILHCKNKVLSTSLNMNKQGILPATVSNPSACTGCQDCYTTCPDGIIEIYMCGGALSI